MDTLSLTSVPTHYMCIWNNMLSFLYKEYVSTCPHILNPDPITLFEALSFFQVNKFLMNVLAPDMQW